MIAKLIARAPTREQALDAVRRVALAETRIEGVTTNLPFLRWLVAHPVVRAGEATTAFLTDNPPLSYPCLCLRAAAPFREPWRFNLPALSPGSHRPTSTPSRTGRERRGRRERA